LEYIDSKSEWKNIYYRKPKISLTKLSRVYALICYK
jgi:hypothetical protein